MPERLWTRTEVLARPSPVPAEPGVYGWYFNEAPARIDTSACVRFDGSALLYVGIAPAKPPSSGRAPSRQHLRIRLRTHYNGNADASTLRMTLGSLLRQSLAITLRPSASGRLNFGPDGETRLSAWMAAHAMVAWVPRAEPWVLEDELIGTLDLPLNLKGNRSHANWQALTRARAAARAELAG